MKPSITHKVRTGHIHSFHCQTINIMALSYSSKETRPKQYTVNTYPYPNTYEHDNNNQNHTKGKH